MAQQTKDYKGVFMLFGLFRIRKDYTLYLGTSGTPYSESSEAIKKLEPWMQKWCTVKWIESDPKTDPQPCYYF